VSEGVTDGRNMPVSSSTKLKLRPVTPKFRNGNTRLKNYLDVCIIRVLKEFSAYELALRYLSGIDGFFNAFTKALNCGLLAANLFTIIYRYGGEWTCAELAQKARRSRQNVHKALTKLEKTGLVSRTSRHRWCLSLSLCDS